MNSESGGYYYNIPATEFKELGVRFQINATNVAQLVTTTETYSIGLSYGGGGLEIPYFNQGNSVESYSIFSIPLNLNNSSINAVFGPSLGIYGAKDKWRVFHYTNGGNDYSDNTVPPIPVMV